MNTASSPLEKLGITLTPEILQASILLPITSWIIGYLTTKNKREIKAAETTKSKITIKNDSMSIGSRQDVASNTNSEIQSIPRPETEKTIQYSDNSAWFQTTLKKTKTLNGLPRHPYGEKYLYVNVINAKSYTTVVLLRNNSPIQIDQSVGGTSCRLEMFERDGTPLKRGIYKLQVRADRGTSEYVEIPPQPFEII